MQGESADAQTVRLPHTCIETPFHYFDEKIYQFVSGYRRRIEAPAEWEGRRIFVTFEGAAHGAEVFLNGKKIGEHRNGYTAFTLELTGGLQPGASNLLSVRLDSREDQNFPPFGKVIDYMTYGGLYREVWLEVCGQETIRDVCIRPQIPKGNHLPDRPMSDEEAKMLLDTIIFRGKLTTEMKVDFGGNEPRGEYQIRQSVTMPADPDFAEQTEETAILFGPGLRTIDLTMRVDQCRLWDILAPNLYLVKTELIRDGETVDCVITRIGFRSAIFLANGFFLNGRKLKIRGLNRHQCYPYVGYAMPRRAQELDAEILKNELMVNTVRTSHYPQSQYFVDRCDELGLLVFTEIPGWQNVGDEAWKKQAVRNTEEMVVQYRNHPSIILWGVRINESQDDDEFYVKTNAVAHGLDPTRQTGGVRFIKKSSLLEDVYTYNDFVHTGSNEGCSKKKDVTPDMEKGYLITEHTGHMFPTKSFDWEEKRRDLALRHANVMESAWAQPDIAGCIGWCMFDYNTHKDFGSGDRICYHGVLDMFRNPKLAAAVYASQQDEQPVLEVSSSMDIGEHPGGNYGNVWIFTNADSVRFYKNDRLITTFKPGNAGYTHLPHPPILVNDYVGDQLAEEEGYSRHQAEEVKALLNHAAAYGFQNFRIREMLRGGGLMLRYRMTMEDATELYGKYIGDWGAESTTFRFEAVKNGQVVAEVRREAMSRVCLRAELSARELTDGQTWDAALLRVTARDENGNVLPYFQECIQVKIEGPAEAIGPDHIQLRGGMGGMYLRTAGEAGAVKVTLNCPGAEPVELELTVAKE